MCPCVVCCKLFLLLLLGCSIIAPSVSSQPEEDNTLFQLSSAIMLNLVPESDYMPQHTRQTETDGRETAPSPTSQQDTHSTMPTSSLPLHMSLSSGFTHSNTISEGETNTLVVLNSHSAVSTTSSGQWSAGLSKNVTSTKQHTKSPTSTKLIESSRPAIVVPGPPPGIPPGVPPFGRPNGPPMSSSSQDNTDIIISVSVIIAVLIIISGIGIVSLVVMYKYRAARRRRVGDTALPLPSERKRRNTPWHLYYVEPVQQQHNE